MTQLRWRPRPRGKNRSYRRFVLVAHERSGSSWITGTLLKHPNAVCFAEVFDGGRANLHVPGLPPKSRWLARLRDRDPKDFLDRFIFCGYSPEISAVGFKVMAGHFANDTSGAAIRELVADPDVAVVRITRLDKLAVVASRHAALQTGVWHLPPGHDHPRPEPLLISPERIEQALAEQVAEDDFTQALVAGRRHLSMTYEDLDAAPTEHFAMIQRHLGLRVMQLPAVSQRQAIRPLRESIANFDQIVQQLQGTKWERYLAPHVGATGDQPTDPEPVPRSGGRT